ncbi:MAG: hypothetical protein MJE66_08320 [Proteobacteria bacterium]|nr:hypothetical protein [Pseudomonadota bacterium]
MQRVRFSHRTGLLALTALWLGVGVPSEAVAKGGCDPDRGFCRTSGVAITGNNNLRGRTVFSFDRVGAITFGQFVGEWNPNGPLPHVIDANTPASALLATIAPPGFPVYGDNAPNVPFQNLRFQDVPTFVSPAGDLGTLPSAGTVSPIVRSSGSNKVDYSLGEWLEARGWLALRCGPKGTTRVRALFGGLVPNGGLYSIWAFWAPAEGPLIVIPFGGSGTNAFATDRRGRARLDLELPYCALDEQDGAVLVAVQLDFHSDDGITGAFPNLPFVEGRGPGIIGHSHLILPVRGRPCEEQGDCVERP